jgi:drug/metabolite transporter (DMT)-like permease
MLISSFLFAFTAVFAKLLAQTMDSLEIVFFRNILGLILILLSITKFPLKNNGKHFNLLLFRGTIGFIALLAYFYNIANIGLAEAMTLSKTSPLFTAIFAYIFLKEKIYSFGWIGIFIGLIGILFITGFMPQDMSKSDWLGIFSGLGAGLAYTSIRELRKYYDSRSIVLSFVTIGTIGPIVLMLLSEFFYIKELDFMMGQFTPPKNYDYLYILGLGTSATLSQIFMTKAYMYNKAGLVGVIGYLNIPFAILFGFLFFDDKLNIYIYCGIVLIIISGFLVAKEKK